MSAVCSDFVCQFDSVHDYRNLLELLEKALGKVGVKHARPCVLCSAVVPEIAFLRATKACSKLVHARLAQRDVSRDIGSCG